MEVFYSLILGCDEFSYCTDGYTTLGVDGFGNEKGHIYTEKIILYENYLSANKQYDYNGFDEYQFDYNQIDIYGVHAKDAVIKY